MITLANTFAKRGLAVDLVLARVEGPYLSEVDSNVGVVDLKASRISLSLPQLVYYLRRAKPNAMLSAQSHVNVIAILARWLAAVPIRLVISERDLSFSDRPGLGKRRLVNQAMKILYPYADHIVSVSTRVSDELSKRIDIREDRLSVIYNPIDMISVETLKKSRPDHPFLSKDFAIIISVGRLDAIKGHDSLLRSISMIESRRNIRALLLGEGPLKAELQQLAKSLHIEDIVDFVGFQKNPFAWMAASDVFVLSSLSDAMPNAMIQAIACGIPVVSTDCPGGPAEILENGRWGRLVPINDPQAMASAIEEILAGSNPPNTRERAKAFDVNVIADAYLDRLGISK